MFRSAMGWVAKRAAKYAGIPLRDPALVALFGNQPASSGVDVDEVTALNYSAVWQATYLISSSLAALPVRVCEDPDMRVEVPDSDPVKRLLTVAPNEEMTPMVMYETLEAHALNWGNLYARIEWDGDVPLEIYPLAPNRVDVERREDGRLFYRYRPDSPGEKDEEYEPKDMIHIPGMSFDGLKGYNVVQQAREAIGMGLATEKYGAALFGRGAVPGGIIEHPGDLTEPARKNLRESFELLHRGPDNAHRIAILDEGMTFKPLALPPETAQFLRTRLFQLTEIARWYNIPPHLLRDLSQATYSNIEHQGIDFLVYTLRPWLVRWTQELTRKLCRRKRYVITHDVTSLLTTDTVQRFTAFNVARQGGWFTLNDILRQLNMATIGEAGDSRLQPANLVPLGHFDDKRAEETAMSGPQIKSIMLVLEDVKAGKIPPESAQALIRMAAPKVSEDLVAAMLRPFGGV